MDADRDPYRARIFGELMAHLAAMPTETLIACLPVVGKYAAPVKHDERFDAIGRIAVVSMGFGVEYLDGLADRMEARLAELQKPALRFVAKQSRRVQKQTAG